MQMMMCRVFAKQKCACNISAHEPPKRNYTKFNYRKRIFLVSGDCYCSDHTVGWSIDFENLPHHPLTAYMISSLNTL